MPSIDELIAAPGGAGSVFADNYDGGVDVFNLKLVLITPTSKFSQNPANKATISTRFHYLLISTNSGQNTHAIVLAMSYPNYLSMITLLLIMSQ